jgi:hypothetical protein
MIDIGYIAQGVDAGVYDTETFRAGNILSVQLGALEYAQNTGIDLRYFLSEDFIFQNEGFKSYLVQTLANQGINISSVIDTVENLYREYVFTVQSNETTTSLVAR